MHDVQVAIANLAEKLGSEDGLLLLVDLANAFLDLLLGGFFSWC